MKPLTNEQIVEIAMRVALECGVDDIAAKDILDPKTGILPMVRAVEQYYEVGDDSNT
jgi:hypothetical protein